MFFCGESSGLEKCEIDIENRVNEKLVIVNWSGSFPTTPRQVLWLFEPRTFPGVLVSRRASVDNERLIRNGCLLEMSTASCAEVKNE
jgi:hypothetical protein